MIPTDIPLSFDLVEIGLILTALGVFGYECDCAMKSGQTGSAFKWAILASLMGLALWWTAGAKYGVNLF